MFFAFKNIQTCEKVTIRQIPYIPENKPRIFGGFYKAKVGGSAYF